MTDAETRQLQSYLNRSEADLLAELALYDATSKGAGDVWAKTERNIDRVRGKIGG